MIKRILQRNRWNEKAPRRYKEAEIEALKERYGGPHLHLEKERRVVGDWVVERGGRSGKE